jgi:hypothetical protein
VGAGNAFEISVGPHRVPLTERHLAQRPIWRRLAGCDVALGVRPESIRPEPDGCLVGSVVSTEVVERRKWVTIELDAEVVGGRAGGSVNAIAGARSTLVASIAHDDPVGLWKPFRVNLDVDRLHLFDLHTGRALD